MVEITAIGTDGNSTTSHLWMGNQWNSGLAETPPGPRKHDLLYWAVLDFNANGTIKQLHRQDEVSFDMA